MQFVSNGLLGFFAWCSRDARFFVTRALFLVVPFAWAGYAVGVTKHICLKDLLVATDESADESTRAEFEKNDIAMLHSYIRIGLGCFMVFMSVFVLIGVCIGGMNRYCCPSRTGGTTPGCKSFCQWIIVCIRLFISFVHLIQSSVSMKKATSISVPRSSTHKLPLRTSFRFLLQVLLCAFNTGYMFVANVGAGMGLTTFFTLSLFLGVETKRAFPTAIVIGGWTSILPAAVNWIVLDGHAYVRLLLTFPGMWLGAIFAPWFSKAGGPMCDLFLYFLLLASCGTAVIVLAAISLQQGEEDVNIDVEPLIPFPPLDREEPANSEDLSQANPGKAARRLSQYLLNLQ